ncbi:NAD(P)-dependent oxidoreductase [Serratia marcescens]|uniref:NAD-dependent epimerase/dehydratase family protein n=1 Tax=Serratia marcescens TaxID=615 RepID=UPI001FD34E7E|nr:NAD(P)-dependent oxidoreductase [Serratia marcescens]UOO26353.1 NAD(P)-dependent oxidoreductase [Serratia marcescens]HBB9122978.1 NAD(P)-dependent oxidoreductase [Serratia marcescens]HBB9124291.1 NAD(P)-dependent oxidoreductase [Serratia marcescens]
MRILIAGATGAIGLPMTRVLCSLGHQVAGLTRQGKGIAQLHELGAEALCVDAMDSHAVREAVEKFQPDTIIDQLTLLPANPADIIRSIPADTALHKVAGHHLLEAAKACGISRYILQSRGFYLDAAAGKLASESAALRIQAPGVIGESCNVLSDYENAVRMLPGIAGVVLRYGFFYGPGTWYRPEGAIAEQARNGESVIFGEGNAVWSFVHIDDAIAATIAALGSEPGTYNIVDDNPLPVNQWLPEFNRWVGAPEPTRLSAADALSLAGEEGLYYHTALTGASNLAAKEKLGFSPRPLIWHRQS